MRIDRARFLLLTSALAGCGLGTSRGSRSPQEAERADIAVAVPSDEAPPTGSAPAAVPREGCNDGKGTREYDKCLFLWAPAGPCEGLAQTRVTCHKLSATYRPAVAEAAFDCIQRLNGTYQVCQPNAIASCVTAALAAACPIPGDAEVCSQVEARCHEQGANCPDCGEVTAVGCSQLLSATRQATGSREAVLQCVTEFCSVATCADVYTPPNYQIPTDRPWGPPNGPNARP